MSQNDLLHRSGVPLDEVDLIRSDIFHDHSYLDLFEDLREMHPVHLQTHPLSGSFWNISRYKDVAYVDSNHNLFSSQGSIVIDDTHVNFPLKMFIAMDPPAHSEIRSQFDPVFTGRSIARYEDSIRDRTATILDKLPVNEEFDWVKRVSTELAIQMLADLLNFPHKDRHKLARWSDIASAARDNSGLVASDKHREKELMECFEYFTQLRRVRDDDDTERDLTGMLTYEGDVKRMLPSEELGNLLLLIVAGNDTTRNSMSGGVHLLSSNPEQFIKVRDDQSLIPGMVSEIIRHQTPLAYMRRTALVDVELGGKIIRAGDKVVMWYVSANMDEAVFKKPRQFIVDRPNVNKHLAFGIGIHRCIGARLALLQLRVLWEEIYKRFGKIEVIKEPCYINSSFIKGYHSMTTILQK